MTLCDELKLDVTCASVLVVSCPAATLQRELLLTGNDRPQRRFKLPISAQLWNSLLTQKTHEALAVPRTTCCGKN